MSQHIPAATPRAIDTVSMISLSGVLRRPDCPAWVPHDDSATEDEAVAAIIEHMGMDALEPALMEKHTGPVRWSPERGTYVASGNFFLCSAGFHISNLSKEARNKLLLAWQAHEVSKQYTLAKKLEAIHKDCEKAVTAAAAKPGIAYHEKQGVQNVIRGRFAEQWRPLEAIMQSILKVGMAQKEAKVKA